MGFCLIINNEDFTQSSPELNNRKGTVVDEGKIFSFLILGLEEIHLTTFFIHCVCVCVSVCVCVCVCVRARACVR